MILSSNWGEQLSIKKIAPSERKNISKKPYQANKSNRLSLPLAPSLSSAYLVATAMLVASLPSCSKAWAPPNHNMRIAESQASEEVVLEVEQKPKSLAV